MNGGPEFWFYHLESQPLHTVLPLLLEKTLSRGWRAVLRFSSSERLDAIDSALWTYRDDSFLPHGAMRDSFGKKQPIFLTLDGSCPNGAQALFLLEVAQEHAPERFERIIRLFDDTDDEAKAMARAEWREAKSRGHNVSYWRQNETAAWTKAG